MLDTYAFGQALKARGYDFYSGVPCSFLSDLINYTINECDYIMAANMLHILLDNNTHDSTDGQATLSQNVDFTTVAAACGYPHAYHTHTLEELVERIGRWRQDTVLTFIHLCISPGSKKGLGRPKLKPHEIKERLMGLIDD